MDSPIPLFKSGVENLLGNELIAQDAAQDALGFVTRDGKEVLIPGRLLIGADSGVTGLSRGLWIGNTTAGTEVLYRKTETKLQYYNTSTSAWVDILTGLTSGTEASFANYSSLAGSFTFFVTTDGLWKINNSFPLNPMNMYNPVVNFHGRILIDKGRMLLWDRNDSGNRDRTAIYGSHIDPQTTPYYVQVANEVEKTGDGSTKVFSGTLATVRTLANYFGLTVYAPTGPSLTVSAITNAVQAQITTTGSHNLSANDTVIFNGVKAGVPLAGTGTISLSGNFTLTGSSTAFTTQLKVGARLFFKGSAIISGNADQYVYAVVRSIESDTSLTVQFPLGGGTNQPGYTVSGASFTYSSMSQLTNIACKVVGVIDATNFQIGVDSTNFDIYSSGDTVNKAEVLTDNRDGTLSSLSGATGTINYITGAYTLTFINAITNAQNIVATYFYENSNNGGITDFSFSSPRLAAEGFIQPQDKGGDPIMNVLIGQDGAYYSLKQQRAYRLSISDDDTTVTNEIYYENMGVPSLNSGVSTQKGILFLNTSNPDKPEMTLLVKNLVSADLLPSVVFPGFRFANYDYSDAYFDTYERYIVISCKVSGAAQNNRILLCNLSDGTVNISPYEARMFAKDKSANLYIGSPLQENTYQIFNGFDDLGNAVNAYWEGAGIQYAGLKSRQARWRFIREELKKFRKFYVKGSIGLDQVVEVWISYDDAPYQQIGTIIGRGTYVDSGAGESIGSNFIGGLPIGGDNTATIYPYFTEIKMQKMPKFRKRSIKFIPTGIGYFDFNFLSDFDIMLFENRLPARFRSKQNVSLDGTETDLDNGNPLIA